MSGLVQGLVWRMRFDGLTVSAKTVLCRLADECRDDGFNAHPSREAIAEDCMISVASVKRALRWLRDVDLIRVDGSASGGRGHTTRYWINVPLIRAHQKERFADRLEHAEPPPPSERGSHRPPLPEEKGVTESLKGVKSGLKGVTAVTHYPYTHLPKSARDVQARPSARSPSPASGRAGPDRKPATSGRAAAGRDPVPVDPAAAERWARLQRAVLNRKVEALFATWVNGATVRAVRICDASQAGVIEVSKRFHASRIAAAGGLSSLLDELGWRVEVSGAGG